MKPEPHRSDSIFSKFAHRLMQFIRHRVVDKTAAEDIFQDVFLKIHDRIDTLKDMEKIEGWIFQIARNAVTDHYRARKQLQISGEPEEKPDAGDDQEMHKKLAAGLGEMIDQLPEHYREALRSVELQGMTQKELADRLGISLSGAKSRVQRARAMLRELLMQCCHFEFDRYGTVIDYHPVSCSCCHDDLAKVP